MKQAGILHGALSAIVAGLGHGESIVIADCGLPVPPRVTLIDLALSPNVPSVEQAVEIILLELVLESAVMARELAENNESAFRRMRSMVGTEIVLVDHATFKRQLDSARAIVRTGDFTPYSNIRLVAGVPF